MGAKPKEKGATEKRALAFWLIVQVIRRLTSGYYIANVTKSDPDETDPFAGAPVLNVAAQTYTITLQGSALREMPPGGGQVYLLASRRADVVTAWGGLYNITAAGVIGPIPATNTGPFNPLPALPWGGKVTLIYVAAALPSGPIIKAVTGKNGFLEELTKISSTYKNADTRATGITRAFAQYGDLNAVQPPMSLDIAYLNSVMEELNVQTSLESRWQDLVRTVAPEAGDRESVFSLLKLVIEQAQWDAERLATGKLHAVPKALPPQFEQSLEVLLPGRQLPPP